MKKDFDGTGLARSRGREFKELNSDARRKLRRLG